MVTISLQVCRKSLSYLGDQGQTVDGPTLGAHDTRVRIRA
jgi:hypothetical protein